MRTIRFRAFNVDTKKFFYFDFNNNGSADTFFGRHGLKENGTWIVSEFVGLKDKKGVEIFEGDIVSWRFAKATLSEVKYFDAAFALWIREAKRWTALTENLEMEVVGNKFENKELLKCLRKN